jgi:hypothetical protein
MFSAWCMQVVNKAHAGQKSCVAIFLPPITKKTHKIEWCGRWSAIFNAYRRIYSDSSGSDVSAIYGTT